MIDTAIALFGKVDILVNNAGIMDGFEPVGEVSNERWEKVFAVNVNGPMYASRKAIQYFLEQGQRQYHQHRFDRRPARRTGRCRLMSLPNMLSSA
jgi:NAD(P)-dependent dehydrogenase (short-subunit alcohol dehydrogenase family)